MHNFDPNRNSGNGIARRARFTLKKPTEHKQKPTDRPTSLLSILFVRSLRAVVRRAAGVEVARRYAVVTFAVFQCNYASVVLRRLSSSLRLRFVIDVYAFA